MSDMLVVDNPKSTQNLSALGTRSSLFPPVSGGTTDLYFVTHAHIDRFFSF
jgi:hypothetical protein